MTNPTYPPLTTLEQNVLAWLRNREEMPSRTDLFAEWSDNSQQTLLRVMARLVSFGLAFEDGDHWANTIIARRSKTGGKP